MGRGSSKAGGEGGGLGGGMGENVTVLSELDVWSYRHNRNNAAFVDSINSSVREIQNDFPGIMGDVDRVTVASLGADGAHTLGFFVPSEKSVSINQRFTNIDKMNTVYDTAVKSGFHPSRGKYNGTEAVTFHEMGHALTDHVGKKMGASGIDDAAKRIVDNAYKNSGGKGGTAAWAKKVSGYATKSNAECVAEAVADWYCNKNNASSVSKAIMAEIKKYK